MQAFLAKASKLALITFFLALAILLVANKTKSNSVTTLDSENYTWNLPEHFPLPIVPENNPMTEAKVELGRYLFFDKRLSGNGTMSCSSCHQQSLAFSDGLPTSIGSTGETLTRNAPSLGNVAYYTTLGWANPELTKLQDQILIPMFATSPIELGISNEDEILERFKRDELYQKLFKQAYPDSTNPITIRRIMLAITSFTRTLITSNSPFDQYVYQEKDVLSESSIRGMQLFTSERTRCIHCHGDFNLTDSTVHVDNIEEARSTFHNIGLYNLDNEGAYPSDNQGLIDFTEENIDMGKFRAPSLRNVALTAPYFHDGSANTLEEVIRIYEAGGRVITEGNLAGDGRESPFRSGLIQPFSITDEERQDLLSFLESLTDTQFIQDPTISDPFN